mgnify:CR=1 FL=1
MPIEKYVAVTWKGGGGRRKGQGGRQGGRWGILIKLMKRIQK